MIRIDRNEVYEKGPDGNMVLVSFEEVEVNIPSPEELLQEKQDELLKVYQELQAIQAQISNN